MVILGITGTLGAGKGTIVDYLVKNFDFQHYSVRGYLIKEIEKRNLPVNRDSMVLVANELREKHGPSYIIEQLYQEALTSGKNTIIESIRAVGEVQALQKKGNFYLFAVDADPQIRYERICLRGSETDHISFEEFISNEQREMYNEDPTKQNLAQCITMAHYKISNNGTFEELYQQVEEIINNILLIIK